MRVYKSLQIFTILAIALIMLTFCSKPKDQCDEECQGEPGLSGEAGEKGDTGAVGPRGVTGATGVTGSTGAKGGDGSNGIDGTNGLDGKDGTDAEGVILIDPCKRGLPAIDFSKAYFGLYEVLIKTSDSRLIGTVSAKTDGTGAPALAEVVVDWTGGWIVGGPTGTSDCSFQYQTVSIDGIIHKIIWFPHIAPTPVNFNADNVTIIE